MQECLVNVNFGVCLNALSSPGLFLSVLCRDSDTAVKGRSIILEIELTYLKFFYMYLDWSHFSSSSWPPIWFEALVTHHPSLLADLACLGTASDAVLSSGWVSSDCCTHVHHAASWHFRVPKQCVKHIVLPEISVSYGLV